MCSFFFFLSFQSLRHLCTPQVCVFVLLQSENYQLVKQRYIQQSILIFYFHGNKVSFEFISYDKERILFFCSLPTNVELNLIFFGTRKERKKERIRKLQGEQTTLLISNIKS
ncbi:hypothetical protein BDF14DRAFT_767547 [Spinellus fusiger]|nr:hypothetical protein BDF14DRAFT_767547 [Spinellus fusiger]